MSTSIYGFVEVKLFDNGLDDWYSVIDTGAVLIGNYDFFGCLFGIRNPSNFEPLFANRGIPEDCCDEIKQDFQNGGFLEPTWCTYKELLNINFDEKALAPDSRVLQNYNGVIVKGYPNNDAERAQAKIMTRGEALDEPGYKLLLSLMQVLASRYGDSNVRWIAYFD